MNDVDIAKAHAAREERFLDELIDDRLSAFFSAKDVSPQARAQLRSLLKHYAKSPHPFRACVRDNMERFGPGRTEKVCAVLKDMIRGTTRWRNDSFAGSDSPTIPVVSEEVAQLVEALPQDRIDRIVAEVAAHG